MRIAIATDQDFVSSCFGCCPDCTIVEIEGGRVLRTFVVPNPGWRHKYWADFLQKNSVESLIVGNIGANAKAVIRWAGIQVLSGVTGQFDDVIRRYLEGSLQPGTGDCSAARHAPADSPCQKSS
ncbi:MAG: NifB/NifX family molybdenum-iron cluster-binding protein [Candidatus Aminicenantales bacterium]